MNYQGMSGKIKDYGLPLLATSQVEQADTAAVFEPGVIVAVRNNTAGAWSLAEYIQLDNNGCSQGEVLVTNFATLKQYSMIKAATAEGRQPMLRGIAAATIASQKFGWMYIWGYVEKADLSHTAASGELLCISASTAGKLTPDAASSALNATLGTSINATTPWTCAIARTAIATGIGSVSLIGMWG